MPEEGVPLNNVVYLPFEEYKKKWESLMGSYRWESPNIDPAFKKITSVNSKYPNEYERMMDEWRNPPMPRCINEYGANGVTTYYPTKKVFDKLK